MRCGGSEGVAALLFCRKFENIASAAARVGSSFFAAAGVPVLDLDRLVDFPNDPVSGTALRDLGTGPSFLRLSIHNHHMISIDSAYPGNSIA